MTDKFDPTDFDTPTEAPDHRALLDEMRQAAVSGVQSATKPLVAAASEIQRQVKELEAAAQAIRSAETSVRIAQSSLFWNNAKNLLLYAAVAALVLTGAGWGWHFVKAPKVEHQAWYCTDWNAKTGKCRVQWRQP